MKTPLITICLPNLNTLPYLKERMDTILAQTVTDWELIICDSYSKDGAWEFFQQYKGDPRIQMFQAPKLGTPGSWNYCLDRARGDYIYVATSDDTMSPTCLEELVKPLTRHPEIKISVCDFEVIDAEGRIIQFLPRRPFEKLLGKWLTIPHIRTSATEFLLHASFGSAWCIMNAVLFHRDILKAAGPFRHDIGPAADIEWSLRAALKSDVAFVPGKLAGWRRHDKQATPQNVTRPVAKTMLDCLETVVHDPQAGIPAAWRAIPAWEERVTHMPRMGYYDSCGLFRSVIRTNPRQFLKNVGYAITHEQKLLLSQALRGFAWDDKFNPSYDTYPLELINLFKAPWPPAPLS